MIKARGTHWLNLTWMTDKLALGLSLLTLLFSLSFRQANQRAV
jgi:hypothetical protein